MKLLLYLSYIGKDFSGYQVQVGLRTVQGELCRAAQEIFGYECDVTGCSRTDRGVHANMFCVTVAKKGEDDLQTHIKINKIPDAMCAHLPEDISVWHAEWCDGEFHPRYDAVYKEYIYRIYNRRQRDPFEEGRSLHYPKKISEDALELMQKAADKLVGEHDFSAFMAQGSKVESTVRNICYAKVERRGDLIIFRVAADGFLYNMVRIITGTLLAVAEGKISPNEIEDIIESCDRSRAGMTAPAWGLYLNKVKY